MDDPYPNQASEPLKHILQQLIPTHGYFYSIIFAYCTNINDNVSYFFGVGVWLAWYVFTITQCQFVNYNNKRLSRFYPIKDEVSQKEWKECNIPEIICFASL